MSKQIQDAYIVAATRTPIGRSHRGFFRNTRPDDLLATTLRAALAQVPGLDPVAIEDIICGCAIPEGSQGLNWHVLVRCWRVCPPAWGVSPSTAFVHPVCRRCRWRPTASVWAKRKS